MRAPTRAAESKSEFKSYERADGKDVRIAGCLIVKDGERTLGGCLESLRELVDEIVVYDTGSTDATGPIAHSLGARVIGGYWDEDFAGARNAALEAVTADRVLRIDADERVGGQGARQGRHRCGREDPAAAVRAFREADASERDTDGTGRSIRLGVSSGLGETEGDSPVTKP
jgi:hypothetical protein